MRGILRGLSNAIFRKLPIKLLLILLAVFSVLFAFTNAESFNSQYYSTIQHGLFSNNFFSVSSNQRNVRFYNGNISNKYICVAGNMHSNFNQNSSLEFSLYTCPTEKSSSVILANDSSCRLLGVLDHVYSASQLVSVQNDYCYDTENVDYMYIVNNVPPSDTRYIYFSFYFSDLENAMSQSDCELNYSLIPVSSIDTNYCVSNNLCPSSPGGDGQWSALYINDIQHEGAGIIDITIPEEISWDYSNINDTFSLDIEGYNVDTDYINAIIGTQSYTPDSNDFSKVVSDIIPLFVPGLVVILFLYFVFRFIKKIF